MLLVFICVGIVYGNSERQHIRKGNALYNEGNFSEAELEYRRSLELNAQNTKALFNLGNALYKQGRFEEAAELYESLSKFVPSDNEKASAYHNLGNSLLRNQQLAESVEAYKQALRLNPDDDDTRYNLSYAMQQLQDQPPQEQPSDGDDEDGELDDDGQQDQQDQSGDDEQQQDQGQQQDEGQQQQDDSKQPARPDKITPQDAERILDALNQKEQNVQDEMQRQQIQVQPGTTEKEW